MLSPSLFPFGMMYEGFSFLLAKTQKWHQQHESRSYTRLFCVADCAATYLPILLVGSRQIPRQPEGLPSHRADSPQPRDLTLDEQPDSL
ncbi:hypothetical protein JMJ77_0002320 [Colletotrichum scovillei]|uniref:Uncharacterized protein n=1 Tax=Colletotrichum scovillei TaxID=1209932 RepID=A0A9P7R7R2_9PEZI|nr:hypothetical protein JMJ77_0002320 [Colletotrichum scovillei]KAG7070740.1 hypothetical protein JMJ76_0001986 [Colletotrichum scovillei]KAG7079009.1 hypothetical protein JMJ78_0002671 [Colletotrichum scovillei]